jgi:hypothetical protein
LFLLSSNYENPVKVTGSDNLAPKYQIGKMEYGDLTNHSVWAQSDWSEGGGKKYWDAYRDGYNVYPYTKKYFSKSGIRTMDYPGELRLGANANLMANFPETTGKIVKIATYSTTVYVAVNLVAHCKIYRTADKGATWELFYDSRTEGRHYHSSPTYTISNFTEIVDMHVAYPDPTDKVMVMNTSRINPNTGAVIPSTDWDNWADERRGPINGQFVFFTVKDPTFSSFGMLMRKPHGSYSYVQCKERGTIMSPNNATVKIATVEGDFTTQYAGTVKQDLISGSYHSKRIDMGANVSKFFPGQYVDVVGYGNIEVAGIQGTYLVLMSNVGAVDGTPVQVKHSSQTLVLTLESQFAELQSAKDFQGNSMNLYPFDLQIRNKSNNVIGFMSTSCGPQGYSNWKAFSQSQMYDSYSYTERIRKGGPTDNLYLYTYYLAGSPPSRDGLWIEPDTRNYIVLTASNGSNNPADYSVGDDLEINQTTFIKEVSGAYLTGNYQRKNTTWSPTNVKARDRDVFYVASSRYIYKVQFPCDAFPANYSNNPIWCQVTGTITAFYNESSERVLCVGSKDNSLVKSYVCEIDETTTGTAVSLFDVGEERISTLVKHNEFIYVGTNFKGRIYVWDSRAYEILSRFDLDPETNATEITAAEVFQDKILFTDNYNGNILSWDPNEGIWDDLCSPEYLKEKPDLITTMASLGGSLFIGTNKADNLIWEFNETNTSSSGHIVSSWYSAEMPAIDKKGLYAQILTQHFIDSTAKVRLAIQFDYEDTWYYLGKEKGLDFVTEPTEAQEVGYDDLKSVRAFYFFFPYDSPKFKTARYRLEIVAGEYESGGETKIFRPVINNIDLFYILTDPKELLFTYPILLEDRQQTLGGPGSNEIGRHKDKLAFLMDIWNNDRTVQITHVDGTQYHCIPFKPQQLQGGGLSVIYNNVNAAKKDLTKLSYLVSIMFKNINKIDNYGK